VRIANDILPRVRFLAATTGTNEATPAMIDLVLDKPSPVTVTVQLAIDARSTAESSDYALPVTPIDFAPGQTTARVTIMPVDDVLDEEDVETVELELTSPSANLVLGSQTATTIELADNDAPPGVSFQSLSQQVSELASVRTVEVRLSAASARVVTVPFNVAGTATPTLDYGQPTNSPLDFPPGTLSRSITISIVNDMFHESDETIVFTFGTPTHANPTSPSSHTVIILAND
jgi:hypothetical protein